MITVKRYTYFVEYNKSFDVWCYNDDYTYNHCKSIKSQDMVLNKPYISTPFLQKVVQYQKIDNSHTSNNMSVVVIELFNTNVDEFDSEGATATFQYIDCPIDGTKDIKRICGVIKNLLYSGVDIEDVINYISL